MRCSADDGMSDACAVVVAAEHAMVHGRAVLLAAGERFAGTTADARTMERGCLVHMPVQEVAHCVGSRVPWRYTETGRFFSLPGTTILPVSGLRNAFGPLQALTPTGAPASACSRRRAWARTHALGPRVSWGGVSGVLWVPQILGAPLAQHVSREMCPYRRGLDREGAVHSHQRGRTGARTPRRRCAGGAQAVRGRRTGDAQEAHIRGVSGVLWVPRY